MTTPEERPCLQNLGWQMWEDLLGPWFPISAIGCCIMSCKQLRDDLGTETIWEKVYENLIEARCGAPIRMPSSWRALCRRRFLRSVDVEIAVHCDIPEIHEENPWLGTLFENRRVATDLTARACVPPVDPLECPWKSSALIFEWHLSRSRFDDLHRTHDWTMQDPVSKAELDMLGGEGTWEQMALGGDDAFNTQARVASLALKDVIFHDVKPGKGQASCTVAIEPCADGDVLLRHVVNFEAAIKQTDESSRFSGESLVQGYRKSLTCGASAADPILSLRRGKDKNISTIKNSVGGLAPKAAAIRRALKMATRTAYKAANTGTSPRKLHSWNFRLKIKTFMRALGLQMSHALYIPTACNRSGFANDEFKLAERGLTDTITLLRLNSVRLSSFTGVVAIKFEVPFPFFQGALSGEPLDCDWGSSTSGSIGALSDVSSQPGSDDEEERADTVARCELRAATQEDTPLIADWCSESDGPPRQWFCRHFARVQEMILAQDTGADQDETSYPEIVEWLNSAADAQSSKSLMDLLEAATRFLRLLLEWRLLNDRHHDSDDEAPEIAPEIGEWLNSAADAQSKEWGGVRIALVLQLIFPEVLAAGARDLDLESDLNLEGFLVGAKTQIRDFLTSEQMEFIHKYSKEFSELGQRVKGGMGSDSDY